MTRASAQAGRLVALLRAERASVIEVPVIEILEPEDGGRGLREAVNARDRYDWVVVTSPNGAERLAEARGSDAGPPIAAVGPGTAAALTARGLAAAVVPDVAVGEALVGAMPAPASGGRVLVAQGDRARPVVAQGLRSKGWEVDVVVAYRTVPAKVPAHVRRSAAGADAITFASGSAVAAYLEATGRTAVPDVVVVIGPVTRAVAEAAGLRVRAEAQEHTLEGLVAATVQVLG